MGVCKHSAMASDQMPNTKYQQRSGLQPSEARKLLLQGGSQFWVILGSEFGPIRRAVEALAIRRAEPEPDGHFLLTNARVLVHSQMLMQLDLELRLLQRTGRWIFQVQELQWFAPGNRDGGRRQLVKPFDLLA